MTVTEPNYNPDELELAAMKQGELQQDHTPPIDPSTTIAHLAEYIAADIRKQFPEERVADVVSLTKEQVETVLHLALKQSMSEEEITSTDQIDDVFNIEEAFHLLQQKKKNTKLGPVKNDERLLELSNQETSKFTTRAFGLGQLSFVKQMALRVEQALVENQINMDTPEMKKTIRLMVLENIRHGLQTIDKALNFNHFIDSTKNTLSARERYDLLQSYEALRTETHAEEHHRLVKEYIEATENKERENFRAALEQVKTEVLQRLRELPCPYYLFQAVEILTKEAHIEFLQFYDQLPEVYQDTIQGTEVQIVKTKLPEDIREALLGTGTLDLQQYRVKYINTLPDFATALEDAQHIEIRQRTTPIEAAEKKQRKMGRAALERMFDAHKNVSYGELLLALGHMSQEEFNNEATRKHILDTFDNAVEKAVKEFEGVQGEIEALCKENGVPIPTKGLNVDIHNRAKSTTLLELLTVISDDSYNVQDRFGAQIIATEAFYAGVIAHSELYNAAEEIRRTLSKAEIGQVATEKHLHRLFQNVTLGGQNTGENMLIEYYDVASSNSQSQGNGRVSEHTAVPESSEKVPIRFWAPNGGREFEIDPETGKKKDTSNKGVYFMAPSTMQTKPILSIVMKLIVPNIVNKLDDIFDLDREGFNLCYSKEEIASSMRQKEEDQARGVDNGPYLVDNIQELVKHIGEEQLGLDYVDMGGLDTEDARATLNNNEFFIEFGKLHSNARNKKSSSLFGAIKIYARVNGVGVEVQFRPLDTMMGERTSVGSHGFYGTTRWIAYRLEQFAKSVYPVVQQCLRENAKIRSEKKKLAEQTIAQHFHDILTKRGQKSDSN